MKKNALTIVELLVVVAVASILSVILFPPFRKSANTARAKLTFGNINQIGLKESQKTYSRDYINYGLEHNIFTQEQVDFEQEVYMDNERKLALEKIYNSGIESLLTKELDALIYAINNGSLTIEEITAKQKEYEKSRTDRIKINLEILKTNQPANLSSS